MTDEPPRGLDLPDPPLRVLVVDDQMVSLKLTALKLTSLGCHVDLAQGGERALELLARHRYGLVLMDCDMPDPDGLETTRRWRRVEGSGVRVPVVAVSAHSLASDRERALSAGMDQVLAKPVSESDLTTLLQKWAPRPSLGPEPDRTAAVGVTGGPARPVVLDGFDPARLERLLDLARVHPETGFEAAFRGFVEDWPGRVRELRAAAARGEAGRVELRRLAHALKGVSALLGAHRIVALGAELEVEARTGTLEATSHLIDRLEPELEQAWSAMRQLMEARSSR